MARALTQAIKDQITEQDIKLEYEFYINDVDYSDYVLSWNISNDRNFGSASATFDLENTSNQFGSGGTYELYVGDVIKLVQKYEGDTTEFNKFYGFINQKSIRKTSTARSITLVCLDYVSSLQFLDIDLTVEGTKVSVDDETLVPTQLASPNEKLAQVYDFANDSICTDPLPILTIKDKLHNTYDPQYDGFQIQYSTGQVKLGSPLNTVDNYELLARNYQFYTKGVYAEDILEEILKQENGYGKYLFDETSAEDFVNNHLVETFLNKEAATTDYLTPNYTASTIIIRQVVSAAITAADTSITLDSIEGLPTSGTGTINGDTFTWSSLTALTLSGIPASGSYSLNAHPAESNFEYEATYDIGKVWYFKYSNHTDSFSNARAVATKGLYNMASTTHGMINADSGCLSLWVKFNSLTSDAVIFNAGASGADAYLQGETDNQLFISYDQSEGKLQGGWITSTNVDSAYYDGTLDTASWYNVILSWDLTDGVNLYVNNVIGAGTSVHDGNAKTSWENDIRFGRAMGTTNYLDGRLCEIMFYDTYADTTLRGKLYALTDESTNRTAYWKCNEGILTTVTDSVASSGTSYDLTLTNAIAWGTGFDFNVGDAKIDYIDERFGRIILSEAELISANMRSLVDYSFKTLQATGIEINKITFNPRELDSRYDAVKKLKDYLAPNYIIKTIGDEKIWATYLNQKVTADYTLNLKQNLNYLEDEDLYTRTKFYVKNANPTNAIYDSGIDFYSTGESFKGYATSNNLTLIDEDDEYVHFASSVTGIGYIDSTEAEPIVYLNDVPIDNKTHQISLMPVTVDVTKRTVTKTGCHGISSGQYVKVHSYYYYIIQLQHNNILSSEPIIFYDTTGNIVKTVAPGDYIMNYAKGVYIVPGEISNAIIESISAASYTVSYSTGSLIVDQDTATFKLRKSLFPQHVASYTVTADYTYWTVMMPIHDIASVIDGRWDTQFQIEFYSEPPSNYPLTILDLGQTQTIQAVDVVAGFFKPDAIRKIDVDFSFSLQFSTDGVLYYDVSDATNNVGLQGGSSVSFGEDELGVGFQTRYIKVMLENVKSIEWQDKTMYPVAFSEISIYNDIVLDSEATLIRTTDVTTSGGVGFGDSTFTVTSTTGFTEPESAEETTAYIDGDAFTYTGIESAGTFTGCTFESGSSYDIGDRVTVAEEDTTSIYDDDLLLDKLGDRLYKTIDIDDEKLYTQTQIDTVSKAYLNEFYKNHSKVQVDVLYSPFLEVGQTVAVVDSFSGISNNYFIESIGDTNGNYNLVLARFPS